MALGHGSKTSVSCDQEIVPASQDNRVSTANTIIYNLVCSEVYVHVKPVYL